MRTDMSTARRRLNSPAYFPVHSPTPSWSHSLMNNQLKCLSFYPSMSIGPIPEMRLFQTLTWDVRMKVQGMVKGQCHIVSPLSKLCAFIFVSHWWNRQFLRYSFFEIWPWKILGQCHGRGQRSMSHNSSKIELMHLLFLSRQSDQPFPTYDH